MEEKIYFKPVSSGEKKDKKKDTDKKSNYKILKLSGYLLFLTAVIFIMMWLLKGSKTVSGQYPDNIKGEYLECTSTELDYEKIGNVDVESKEKELKITAAFKDEKQLISISLKNLIAYHSNHDAIIAEARAHANFNRSLTGKGYDSGKFENKFSILGEKLLINLTGNAKEIDTFTKDYFLIKSDNVPTEFKELKREYEAQGFNCRTSTNEED